MINNALGRFGHKKTHEPRAEIKKFFQTEHKNHI